MDEEFVEEWTYNPRARFVHFLSRIKIDPHPLHEQLINRGTARALTSLGPTWPLEKGYTEFVDELKVKIGI